MHHLCEHTLPHNHPTQPFQASLLGRVPSRSTRPCLSNTSHPTDTHVTVTFIPAPATPLSHTWRQYFGLGPIHWLVLWLDVLSLSTLSLYTLSLSTLTCATPAHHHTPTSTHPKQSLQACLMCQVKSLQVHQALPLTQPRDFIVVVQKQPHLSHTTQTHNQERWPSGWCLQRRSTTTCMCRVQGCILPHASWQ